MKNFHWGGKKNIINQKKNIYLNKANFSFNGWLYYLFVHNSVWSENYDTRFITRNDRISFDFFFLSFPSSPLLNNKSIIFATRNNIFFFYRNRYIAKIFPIRSFNNRGAFHALLATIFNNFQLVCHHLVPDTIATCTFDGRVSITCEM